MSTNDSTPKVTEPQVTAPPKTRTTTIEGQSISSERQEPTYYAMLPKMAIMDLAPYELALYAAYKQTASEHGVCFKSNATLAREIGMSISKLKEARKTLEAKGFIRISYHEDESGVINAPPDITIVDIWAENHRRFAPQGGRQKTTPRSRGDYPPSPENPKEESFKEKPDKKEIAASAAASPKPKKERARNPMFDAIAGVFGYTDEKKPTPTEGGLIGKVSAELTAAGYTPDQIPAIYAYCVQQGFKAFTARALAAHAGNWKRVSGSNSTNPMQGLHQVTDADVEGY